MEDVWPNSQSVFMLILFCEMALVRTSPCRSRFQNVLKQQ